jgi:hypothetical protein
MLQIVASLIDNARVIILTKARIVNHNTRIVIYSFIVLDTVITIKNYNCTVITIVNDDPKTFIVQATVITIENYNRTVITIVNYDPKTFIVQATGPSFQ